jgi:hypothetical protein
MIEMLAREPLPMPDSSASFSVVCARLEDCYRRMSDKVLGLVAGLPVWAELDTGRRQRTEAVLGEVPARALAVYEVAYRDLAADNREFAIWAGLAELRAVGSGLSGMEELLGQIAARRPGDRPLAHLLASYRAALGEPVLAGAQADGSMVFPSLAEAYLTPHCRIGEVRPGDEPASAGWWEQQPMVPDVEVFLTGYLTSLRAVRWPLVVLGEPGSGKSKLTEVLAARLADGDFLPVPGPAPARRGQDSLRPGMTPSTPRYHPSSRRPKQRLDTPSSTAGGGSRSAAGCPCLDTRLIRSHTRAPYVEIPLEDQAAV